MLVADSRRLRRSSQSCIRLLMTESTPAPSSPKAALLPRTGMNKAARVHFSLLVLAIGIGCFARIWEYRQLPPGLNPDEAASGIEAQRSP